MPTWDEVHADREWGTCPESAMARFVRRHYFSAKFRSKVKVLDIGCGVGAQTFWIADEGFDVVGIDSAEHAIYRARLRNKGRAKFHVLEASKVCSLGTESFDAAIDVCCLQHVPGDEIDDVLREIYCVLKPGGRLFSMTASLEHSDEATGGMGTRFVDAEKAKTLYLGAGFAAIDVGYATYTLGSKGLVAHWLLDCWKRE